MTRSGLPPITDDERGRSGSRAGMFSIPGHKRSVAFSSGIREELDLYFNRIIFRTWANAFEGSLRLDASSR